MLLAHDATAATCNSLIDAVEAALGNVDVGESSSVEDARVALRLGPHEGSAQRFHLAMVCLDLPPAPLGGVRLAQEILGRHRMPVVLVTRSLRWIPSWAVALRDLPWVSPDASPDEVARAVSDAMGRRFAGTDDEAIPLARQVGGE